MIYFIYQNVKQTTEDIDLEEIQQYLQVELFPKMLIVMFVLLILSQNFYYPHITFYKENAVQLIDNMDNAIGNVDNLEVKLFFLPLTAVSVDSSSIINKILSLYSFLEKQAYVDSHSLIILISFFLINIFLLMILYSNENSQSLLNAFIILITSVYTAISVFIYLYFNNWATLISIVILSLILSAFFLQLKVKISPYVSLSFYKHSLILITLLFLITFTYVFNNNRIFLISLIMISLIFFLMILDIFEKLNTIIFIFPFICTLMVGINFYDFGSYLYIYIMIQSLLLIIGIYLFVKEYHQEKVHIYLFLLLIFSGILMLFFLIIVNNLFDLLKNIPICLFLIVVIIIILKKKTISSSSTESS